MVDLKLCIQVPGSLEGDKKFLCPRCADPIGDKQVLPTGKNGLNACLVLQYILPMLNLGGSKREEKWKV